MPDDLESVTESLSEVQPVPTAAFMQAQRRQVMPGAIAIAIMLCCLVGLVHLWRSYPPSNPPIDSGRVYETKLGEQRRVVLDEESMITMRGDTRLRVRFVKHFRIATLERGEALFKVTRDPERPFRVFAGNGSVEAVGTEFDVRRYAERIRVEVTDGAVDVATRAHPIPGIATDAHPSHVAQSMAVRLKRGEEITYEMDGSAGATQFINIRRVAERMAGFFVFEDQSLHQVIDEVQPDFPRQIILDATAARIRYHGSIKKETIEQWVRALPDLYPVEVLDSASNSIVIRAKR
jgi:transmembrane sensor